jgi:hypothetical protein
MAAAMREASLGLNTEVVKVMIFSPGARFWRDDEVVTIG